MPQTLLSPVHASDSAVEKSKKTTFRVSPALNTAFDQAREAVEKHLDREISRSAYLGACLRLVRLLARDESRGKLLIQNKARKEQFGLPCRASESFVAPEPNDSEFETDQDTKKITWVRLDEKSGAILQDLVARENKPNGRKGSQSWFLRWAMMAGCVVARYTSPDNWVIGSYDAAGRFVPCREFHQALSKPAEQGGSAAMESATPARETPASYTAEAIRSMLLLSSVGSRG